MRRCVIAVVVFATFVSTPALAVTRNWTGLGGNANWSTPGNWNPAGTPVAGEAIAAPSGGPLTMVNDLPATILSVVGLDDAYVVSGNAIHVSNGINAAQATFNAPVVSEGNDVQVAAAHFAQLNPNGHRIVWRFGTIGELVGIGDFSPASGLPPMTLTGTHSFSGTVFTADVMVQATPIVLAGASLPSATFWINRELDGYGQIGPFKGSGAIKPSTDADPIGTIAMGDLAFSGHHLPELIGDFSVDIAGDNANDMLDVAGSVSLAGRPLTVALLNGYSPATDTSWMIVNNDGADGVEGLFNVRDNGFSTGKPLEEGQKFTAAGRVFKISYVGGTGNDVTLTAVDPNVITTKTPTAISATAWLANCVLLVSGHVTSTIGSSTPSGTMKVRNGSEVLGTVPLDGSGNATLQVARPLLVHAIHVEFVGNAEFANSMATANLIIADQVAPTISIDNATAYEDAGSISTTVELLPAPCHPTDVHYATSNGSAIAGEDYDAMSGTIEFAQGQSSRTIVINLHADTNAENDETFNIQVSGGGGAHVLRAATLTIANDDEPFLLYSDLQYGTVSDAASGIATSSSSPLLLDLRIPIEGDGPFPLVVVIDAVRWSAPNHHSAIADFLPQHGYAVATIAFRPVSMGVFPAQLDDVRTALTWLRNNATQYRLNTLRMAVLGSGRAGGNLAALAAVSDSPGLGIDAAIIGRGATDLMAFDANNCDGENDVAAFLGCTPSSCITTAIEASPSTHASRGDGPFLILETNEDCGQSQLLANALHAANVEATLRNVPSGGHAPDWSTSEVQANVLQFLEAKLVEQRGRSRAVRK